MRYQGGKTRLKKTIVPLLMQHNPTRIIEPFLGGGSIMVETHKQGYTGQYVAGDYNQDLNEMWRAIVEDGWMPDDSMKPTREEYNAMKNAVDAEPTALRGMCRTGISFGSKPWDAYILDYTSPTDPNRNYWISLLNAVKKDCETVTNKNITITGGDYSTYEQYLTTNSVVYCDPPYANTTGYDNPFNNETFWDVMREWSQLCPVYISEYNAPEDFVAVHSKEIAVKLQARTKNKKEPVVKENIYVHKNNLIR